MANALTSAGVKLSYCAETTAGTRPTTGYTLLPGVTAIPSIGADANPIDCTPLNATNHQYVQGLPDNGGAVSVTVNDSSAFRTAFTTFKAAVDALTGGKQMWIQVSYPDSSMDSFFFPCGVSALGFGGADVDSVMQNTINFTIEGDFVFATAGTITT